MKKTLGSVLIIAFSIFAFAQTPDLDPCTLIDKEDLAKIFGEIKEGPKPKEGLMKEKECAWTNISGSWLSVSVYSSERWGLKKGSANNPVDVKGLGEEAFSDKRGTDAELYVRKGKSILEVRTSGGSEVARKAAETAIKKIP
ncbi:MAG: hypothetical protein ABI925_08240 [Verrucomicrobiota bacterium]